MHRAAKSVCQMPCGFQRFAAIKFLHVRERGAHFVQFRFRTGLVESVARRMQRGDLSCKGKQRRIGFALHGGIFLFSFRRIEIAEADSMSSLWMELSAFFTTYSSKR